MYHRLILSFHSYCYFAVLLYFQLLCSVGNFGESYDACLPLFCLKTRTYIFIADLYRSRKIKFSTLPIKYPELRFRYTYTGSRIFAIIRLSERDCGVWSPSTLPSAWLDVLTTLRRIHWRVLGLCTSVVCRCIATDVREFGRLISESGDFWLAVCPADCFCLWYRLVPFEGVLRYCWG